MRHMVFAAFSFAVMAAFARLAGARLPAQEIVLFRALIATALTLAMIARARASVVGRRPFRLALRGVTGFLALSCYFWSVLHLPFNEAVLISQVSPLFTAVLAWRWLGERPGRRFAPGAALVLAGVALVSPPNFGDLRGGFWVGVAFVGAFLTAAAYTQVRDLSRTEHPLTIVFWFQAISIVLSVPGTVVSGPVWPRGLEWAWLAGVGLAGQVGQVHLTEGLRRSPAGRGALANPLVVFFGALLAWALFNEGLDWGDLVGAGLMISGLLVVGLTRTRAEVCAAPTTPAD